jgi:hypothetical protein
MRGKSQRDLGGDNKEFDFCLILHKLLPIYIDFDLGKYVL